VLDLAIRLIASLAVVVGLLLLLARIVGRRFAGREGAAVQVLHRQPISRSASVAVVSVGTRVLVVGATDHQVQLLAEVDPADLEQGPDTDTVLSLAVDTASHDLPRPVGRPAGAHRAATAHRAADPGALAGSVLSARTWRQAFAAATGKAS
jgi:flagellar protein FliO/FliZ